MFLHSITLSLLLVGGSSVAARTYATSSPPVECLNPPGLTPGYCDNWTPRGFTISTLTPTPSTATTPPYTTTAWPIPSSTSTPSTAHPTTTLTTAIAPPFITTSTPRTTTTKPVQTIANTTDEKILWDLLRKIANLTNHCVESPSPSDASAKPTPPTAPLQPIIMIAPQLNIGVAPQAFWNPNLQMQQVKSIKFITSNNYLTQQKYTDITNSGSQTSS